MEMVTGQHNTYPDYHIQQGKMYFELSDDVPIVVLPPIQPPNPPDTNITITPIDVPWDFQVNRNQRDYL